MLVLSRRLSGRNVTRADNFALRRAKRRTAGHAISSSRRVFAFECERGAASGNGRGREGEERRRVSRRRRREPRKDASSNSCSPGISAQRRSATRHGEHHRNARRPYAGHRDARLRRGAFRRRFLLHHRRDAAASALTLSLNRRVGVERRPACDGAEASAACRGVRAPWINDAE